MSMSPRCTSQKSVTTCSVKHVKKCSILFIIRRNANSYYNRIHHNHQKRSELQCHPVLAKTGSSLNSALLGISNC